MKKKFKLLLRPWGEVVEAINKNGNILVDAYNYVILCLEKAKVTEDLIELMIGLLEHNNIIFYSSANYSHYQAIASYLFKNIESAKITEYNKNRFFLISVYSDYYLQSMSLKKSYEERLLQALYYFERYSCDYKFLGFIHVSQFYLFMGNLVSNKLYLEKAKNVLNECSNINYKLFFLYHYSWSFYESGDFNNALKIANEAILLVEQQTPIALQLYNIKSAILYKLRKYKESIDLAQKTYNKAKKVFIGTNLGVLAESLLTMARSGNDIGDYKMALLKAKKGLKLLNILFGSDHIDPSQASALVVIGDAFVGVGMVMEGNGIYDKALGIYKDLYGNKYREVPQVLELLNKQRKARAS